MRTLHVMLHISTNGEHFTRVAVRQSGCGNEIAFIFSSSKNFVFCRIIYCPYSISCRVEVILYVCMNLMPL